MGEKRLWLVVLFRRVFDVLTLTTVAALIMLPNTTCPDGKRSSADEDSTFVFERLTETGRVEAFLMQEFGELPGWYLKTPKGKHVRYYGCEGQEPERLMYTTKDNHSVLMIDDPVHSFAFDIREVTIGKTEFSMDATLHGQPHHPGHEMTIRHTRWKTGTPATWTFGQLEASQWVPVDQLSDFATIERPRSTCR